jgi:hypothetical protein
MRSLDAASDYHLKLHIVVIGWALAVDLLPLLIDNVEVESFISVVRG